MPYRHTMLRLALKHFKLGDEKTARRILENAEATGILDSRVGSLMIYGIPNVKLEKSDCVSGI